VDTLKQFGDASFSRDANGNRIMYYGRNCSVLLDPGSWVSAMLTRLEQLEAENTALREELHAAEEEIAHHERLHVEQPRIESDDALRQRLLALPGLSASERHCMTHWTGEWLNVLAQLHGLRRKGLPET
jgi:hypothetical protein